MSDMNFMNTAMIELIGFSETGSKTISNLENDNFKGYVRMEKNGNLLYELIIPFSKIPAINDQPGKKNISPFILGISYQSVPTMGGPSGGAPGGGGGMSGGGRGMSGGSGGRSGSGGGKPGGNSGSGPGLSQGSEAGSQTIFWIKDIRLATDK
jgi:hypothetical protein